MIGNVLGLVLALLVVPNVECEDPPKMVGSYIAWGEIVQPVAGMNELIVIQTAFEESYDASTQNAAFFMWLAGKNLTFVKNYNTNQTFLYTEVDKQGMRCIEATEKEWMESDFAPGLLAYEDDDGTIKFSLKQLFNIPNEHLMDTLQGVDTTYRGIPSKSWAYEIKVNKKDDDKYDQTLSITAYWSDENWNTTAGQKVTPLGFNVSKMTWSETPLVEDYIINVFGFVPNAYDHKYFEPYQGIICPTRKQTLKFPDVKNIRAISLHSEMALPDYEELRYIDAWYDPASQLLRLDVERMKDEDPMERKSKHYQSEISIGKMGVVFRWGYYKGEAECEVIPFDKYENDLQNLFDVKQNPKRWHMGRLFGLNDTSYVYLGKTTKNDIPCHLFQGIRKDFPDVSSNITSLWEWCFNVNMSKMNDIVMFLEGEFGLISADVTILSHPTNTGYNNFRMRHHFYDVREQDPKILDATSFDIGRCFQDTQKRLLQFFLDVDIGDDNRHLYENVTSDINFLQKWKSEIYRHSGLPEFSLRVSNVRATIDDHKLYVKFSLLPAHEKLPKAIHDSQKDTIDAEMGIRDSVNKGKMSILHAWNNKGKAMKMTAVENSVSFQVDRKFEPQTLPPLPETTPTTPFVFTLRTEPTKKRKTDGTPGDETTTAVTGSTSGNKGKGSSSPDDIQTTTPSAEQNKIVQKMIGHGPGSVAGVSIAILLVGITIGSAGTFYKFNGLPGCLKR